MSNIQAVATTNRVQHKNVTSEQGRNQKVPSRTS